MTSQKHREPYFHTPSGYVYNFIAILKQTSGIAHIGAAIINCSHWSCHQELLTSDQNCRSFGGPRKPESWQITYKSRTPLLCHFKLCASFCKCLSTQTWQFLSCVTLKNNIKPLLCQFKIYISLRSHWGKICFDLWPLVSFVPVTQPTRLRKSLDWRSAATW